MATQTADINPTMLRWARERAGYDIDVVAKKVGVNPDRIRSWESGSIAIPLGRLEFLADLYKRPTILFYLERPPAEPEVSVPDFHDKKGRQDTPELRYQVRRAHERRLIALDLLRALDEKPKPFTFECTLNDEIEKVGAKLRDFLGVSLGEQRTWKSDTKGYKALSGWKAATEAVGVLVTQAPKKDLAKSRGLSLYGELLPIVVLASESTHGRIFTLLHELAHLGLRQGGICDLHDAGVELFCNRVAAATLLPAASLRTDYATNKNIGRLAQLYSVSEQALALRLLSLGLVSQEFYNAQIPIYLKRSEQAQSTADKKSNAIPQHVLVLSRNGQRYTRLVIDAYHHGALTAHRAATSLGTSFKWVKEIERDIVRQIPLEAD